MIESGKPKKRPLRAAAGWIITGALIYAPFAFGSVLPFAIQQLNIALSIATGFWILDCLVTRSVPRVPIIVVVSGIIALACGWFMTWNARSMFVIHNMYIIQAHVLPHRPTLPGALEMQTSKLTMIRLDSLFGGMLAATDLASSREWRNRFVIVIACTGAAIAAFGVAQQAGMVTFVATRMSQIEGQFFATYNYHGNAGAYMNLALPLSFALCLYSIASRKPVPQRYATAALFGVTVVGILANTSRGAQAVSAGILIGMGWAAAPILVKTTSRIYRSRHFLWPLVAMFTIVGLGLAALHSTHEAEKWRELPSELAKNSSRWQVWRVTVPMAKSAGALGHGPGSFKMLLPASPLLSDALLSRWVLQPRIIPGLQISMWSMAHNDYLQTWVEFGWVGLALACTILFGGTVRAIKSNRGALKDVKKADGFLVLGVNGALLGVIVNSLFDFPMQVASIQVTIIVLLGICWRRLEAQ